MTNSQDSARPGLLAAFAVPGYRFQYTSDLLVAWAIEIEVIVLAWYVLVATDSPFLVALLGALRFLGTLISPFLGAFADRVPRRLLLCGIRAVFTAVGATLLVLAMTDRMAPWVTFAAVSVAGLLRPADMMLRQSLIADVMPRAMLTNAMGFFRMTIDSSRMFGALAGAGLLTLLGIAATYGLVVTLYALSLGLLIVAGRRVRIPAQAARGQVTLRETWQELRAGWQVAREHPAIWYLLWLAFVVNVTMLSITGGMLPVIARDAFGMGAAGLGVLAATFAGGALLGSTLVATWLRGVAPELLMWRFAIVWHGLMVVFATFADPGAGTLFIAFIGVASSLVMVPMSAALLLSTPEAYRGRIMGLRQLAVFGLPLGLVFGGSLTEWLGVQTLLFVYGAAGALVCALLFWLRVRADDALKADAR